MQPKVSVIIPAYNAEKTIEKCLNSVIDQTYRNLEIIIINDGSQDETINKISKYREDKRVIIINQDNSGVSETRNRGIKKASGDYIMFIDSDDWLESNTIEELVNISRSKDVEVVRYNCYYQENKKITVPSLYNLANKKIKSEDFEKERVIEHFLLNKEPIKNFVMLLFIQKSVFENGLKFQKELYMMEDVYFYLNMFKEINSIYFLDMALYHYCDNENSATKSPNKYKKNIYGIINTNKYIKKYLIENNIIVSKIKELNGNHLRIICYYLYYIYKQYGSTELIKTYKEISRNKDFYEILKNITLNELTFYWKIIVMTIKMNLVYFTCGMFYIRKKRERSKKNGS